MDGWRYTKTTGGGFHPVLLSECKLITGDPSLSCEFQIDNVKIPSVGSVDSLFVMKHRTTTTTKDNGDSVYKVDVTEALIDGVLFVSQAVLCFSMVESASGFVIKEEGVCNLKL